MSPRQFKLFEFDFKDEYEKQEDKTEASLGTKDKKFVVQMFGINEKGETACIFVKDFKPFFYVKVNDNWTEGDMMEFVGYVRAQMGEYYGISLIKCKFEYKQTLYGFDNKKKYTFIKLIFNNVAALNKAKNSIWYKDTITPTTFERKLTRRRSKRIK